MEMEMGWDGEKKVVNSGITGATVGCRRCSYCGSLIGTYSAS
jgi:hypothetical protein